MSIQDDDTNYIYCMKLKIGYKIRTLAPSIYNLFNFTLLSTSSPRRNFPAFASFTKTALMLVTSALSRDVHDRMEVVPCLPAATYFHLIRTNRIALRPGTKRKSTADGRPPRPSLFRALRGLYTHFLNFQQYRSDIRRLYNVKTIQATKKYNASLIQ